MFVAHCSPHTVGLVSKRLGSVANSGMVSFDTVLNGFCCVVFLLLGLPNACQFVLGAVAACDIVLN